MKQSSKNEIDLLGLINKIQTQLTELDKKMETLIHRSIQETKFIPKPTVNNAPAKPNDRPKERVMYTAICADCNKECKIPFKPSGDRPVYCQDCFSRRKVINLSGVTFDNKPKAISSPQAPSISSPTVTTKSKKKTMSVKKPLTKKKPIAKKNKKK